MAHLKKKNPFYVKTAMALLALLLLRIWLRLNEFGSSD